MKSARLLALLIVATLAAGCGGSSSSSAAGIPPGKSVPATAPPSPPAIGSVRIAGAVQPQYTAFDRAVAAYMQANGLRGGQLAFGRAGTVLFSHAYTNTTDPVFPVAQPTSVMRLASVSKAFTAAAVTALYASGAVGPGTPVFPYLGIGSPLLLSQSVDPRINRITVQQLVDHTAGLPAATFAGPITDPTFLFRSIEDAAGLRTPLTKAQFAQYIYGLPLASDPGSAFAYSNVGYQLLGMVVEKASGGRFIDYLSARVLAPLGIGDVLVERTDPALQPANQVPPDVVATGLTALDPTSSAVVSASYGGATIWEDVDSAVGLETSAASLVRFIGSNAAFGLGGRSTGAWRNGCSFGAASYIESRPDGVDLAFTFNFDVECYTNQSAFPAQIDALIAGGI